MKVAELDTILLREDMGSAAQLRCLSCRRRLAKVELVRTHSLFGDLEQRGDALSVSLTSQDMSSFQQSSHVVTFTCGCGVRSAFHLI